MASTNTYNPREEKDFGSFSKLLGDIDLQRFVKARPGTKRPEGEWVNHYLTQVGRDSLIETGNGLMVWDVDDATKLSDGEKQWLDDNPTLTIQSPHAEGREGHYYFLIDGYEGAENFPWGELKYGSLVMTPGSEVHGIRGGDDCDEGCCSLHNPGTYTIKVNSPARSITVEGLPIDVGESKESDDGPTLEEFVTEEELKQTGPVTSPSHRPSRDSTEPAKKYPVDTGTVDFNIGDRLKYGRKKNENFDALCEWAETDGESPVEGYGNDRSRTECALVCHLSFWLERNEKAVRHTMNRLNPPKWAERGDSYRDSALNAIKVQQDSYTGNGSSPSNELTFEVWYELIVGGPLSTAEIAESIDYGQTQTRKALDYLDDKGIVSYSRSGRSGKWTVENETSVDWEGIDDELNSIEARDEYLAQ